MNLARKLTAEFLGTAGLLAVIVGSGIMGENLEGGNVDIALLANTIATGAGLAFLILSFIDVSGAHFNPAVSLTEAWSGRLSWRDCLFYLQAQMLGAFAGVGLANLMFELPAFSVSTKIRTGNAQFLSEFVATFGLIAVIRAGIKFRPHSIALMVAAYITSAFWFTSSTSFANPVVTLARSASNTFAGINPKNAPAFLLAQILGAFAAAFVFGCLFRDEKENV